MAETKIEINGILYADYITSQYLDTLVQGNVIILQQDIVKDNAVRSEGVPTDITGIPKGTYVVSNVTLILPGDDRVLHLTKDDSAKSHVRLMVGAAATT